MTAAFPPVLDLLPHGKQLMLLDRVLAKDAERISVAVAIRPDSLFLLAGQGVPAHVGLEYMAQTCGAFAGLEAMARGEAVRLAYLLGSRRYRAARPWFVLGEQLLVTALLMLRDGNMAVFDCRIEAGGAELATAQLTVFQPDAPPEPAA